jgi:hypothetical protein
VSDRRASTAVGVAGVLLYAVAAFAPLVLYRHFWTYHAMNQEVPWYFMGQALVDGACAAVALALCLILGAVAGRQLGRAVWSSLIPAFLFLSVPIGRGVAILLWTRRIWEGPSAASSAWKTFDQYLYGTNIVGFVSLGIAFVIVFHFIRRRREEAPEGDTVRLSKKDSIAVLVTGALFLALSYLVLHQLVRVR